MVPPGKSSYLQYLPPILWEDEPELPDFSLGAMLRVFEKLLTGIDDGVAVVHDGHDHESIEETIDRLPDLYDPWRTPPEFLEWLGSWVSLAFSPIWSEYQRRKIISQIVDLYQRRGTRDGFREFLDLYMLSPKRPRVAIDDSSRVLVSDVAPGKLGTLFTLVSQGPTLRAREWLQPVSGTTNVYFELAHGGPVQPVSLARAPDGSLLLGDLGTPLNFTPAVLPGLWRISTGGEYETAGVPPAPRRLAPTGSWNAAGATSPQLQRPVALAVDAPANVGSSTPWILYVLDQIVSPTATALYRTESVSPIVPTVLQSPTRVSRSILNVVWPVAMAFSPGPPKRLYVLDRGLAPATGIVAAPRLVTVDASGTTPSVLGAVALTNVDEPVSIIVLSNGAVVVGDARADTSVAPAELVSINVTTGAGTRLLTNAATNPLVCPQALAEESPDTLVVADVGLRPFGLQAATVTVAAPAAIYRVRLPVAMTPPSVEPATESGQLVYPTGLVVDRGRAYVADRGAYADPSWAGPLRQVWRARTSELGVVVHFVGQAQTPSEQRERVRMITDIRDVVARERPAHTVSSIVYQL
jgi:phage tail-like protein